MPVHRMKEVRIVPLDDPHAAQLDFDLTPDEMLGNL
jgi:hypothetical protein